jgi:RHH-type proline utilization regulon transcriptional repressor/proline dehydrogenase/delta 1-pyrroline-5-carboxylate dehydrogenase
MILEWADRTQRDVPLVVRLVKGAYWDHEVVMAQQNGWPNPVFDRKPDTDKSYESLTRSLIAARPTVRCAFGSHNLRSVAHAIAVHRAVGGADADIELQVLRGLGDNLQHALASLGFRVRTYCPVGDLVAGMGYLVRRLLENTANTSFLHLRATGTSLDALLKAP